MITTDEYYTTASLAAAAGVGLRCFQKHLKHNVGNINDAREEIPGMGLRFLGKKCRKYLSLVLADPKRMAKAKANAAAFAASVLKLKAEQVPGPLALPPDPPATPTP